MIRFFCPGVPAPGGSKRAFRLPTGRIVVTDASSRSKPWRAVVQVAAAGVMRGRPPLEGPLRLVVTFAMPRPAGHLGKRGLRASAPAYPATRPDATKLLRALEDALTGIAWRDDAQIVEQLVRKVYATATPGAYVRVEPMPAVEFMPEPAATAVESPRGSRQDRPGAPQRAGRGG